MGFRRTFEGTLAPVDGSPLFLLDVGRGCWRRNVRGGIKGEFSVDDEREHRDLRANLGHTLIVPFVDQPLLIAHVRVKTIHVDDRSGHESYGVLWMAGDAIPMVLSRVYVMPASNCVAPKMRGAA